MHETSERKPTVGGTTATVHDPPPFEEVTMPAPFGAPSTPTVEPTATQRVALGQLTATREFTGVGSVADTKPPCHGESAAMVEGVEAPLPEVGLEVQAPETPAKTADTTTANCAPRERRGSDDACTPGLRAGCGGQRTLMTWVRADLSWNPWRFESQSGERPAMIV